MQKKARDLRTRLLAGYLIVCLVPMFLTVFLISVNSAERIREDTRQKAALYSAQIVRGLDAFTETYSNLTRLLTIDYDVISDLGRETESIYEQMNRNTAVRKLLMRVGMMRPDIRNVMLVTVSGRVYQYSAEGISVSAEALLRAPWFEEIRASSRDLMITPTHYTDCYEGDREGITVSVARRIYGSDGLEKCLLIVDIDPYALVDLSAAQKLEGMEEDLRILIRTENGGLVYDSRLLSGSVTCVVDDGIQRQEIVLDRPDLGLYMPAMVWGTQYRYSANSVLGVFASLPYDSDDYIRDYETFLEERGLAADRSHGSERTS